MQTLHVIRAHQDPRAGSKPQLSFMEYIIMFHSKLGLPQLQHHPANFKSTCMCMILCSFDLYMTPHHEKICMLLLYLFEFVLHHWCLPLESHDGITET